MNWAGHCRTKLFIVGAVPAVAAAAAVAAGPVVATWAHGRQSALPAFLIMLLSAMLHPRLRDYLITTLCYSISFLALRDIFRGPHVFVNPVFNVAFTDAARPYALLVVAAFAAAAGVGETVRPATDWARRCYFGAAGVYALGEGVVGWTGSPQSLLLCLAGVTALFACLLPRLFASSGTGDVNAGIDAENDQIERERAHMCALRAKEWTDSTSNVEVTSLEAGIGS